MSHCFLEFLCQQCIQNPLLTQFVRDVFHTLLFMWRKLPACDYLHAICTRCVPYAPGLKIAGSAGVSPAEPVS